MIDKENIIYRRFCFMYRTESGFGKKSYFTNAFAFFWAGICLGVGASIPLGILFFLIRLIFEND